MVNENDNSLKFKKTETNIKGLWIIEHKIFKDSRGQFGETYNKRDYESLGLSQEFVQDNISFSRKGVLRGLHYQWKFPQEKLVGVIKGEVYDVGVDLRSNSSTFGEYFGILLSEDNNKSLYLPKGFAHGFLALTDMVILAYKVSNYYHQEDDSGIIWNDQEIDIAWPFKKYQIEYPILSKKDKELHKLNEIAKIF